MAIPPVQMGTTPQPFVQTGPDERVELIACGVFCAAISLSTAKPPVSIFWASLALASAVAIALDPNSADWTGYYR